jgi:hypothetical protein
MLRYEFQKHAEYYIDSSSELPQPSQTLLASSAERVIVASTPLQSFVMDLRRISHWENPRESAGYMLLYFVFLVFSQITRMAVCSIPIMFPGPLLIPSKILFVLFKVLHRRWNPPQMDQMEKAIRRSEDQGTTAQTLTDLITKYGTRGWVDHAMDQTGPTLFYYLERTADVLEMVQKLF